MQRNVIILTGGLSGSSVLAGLLGEAGYWIGDATFKKPGYDTYENQQLIALNQRLFHEIGYDGQYEMVFPDGRVRQIAEAVDRIDPAPYKAFIEQCNQHRPWAWKDPRLTLTIRFWSRLLDLSDVQFIVLNRESRQSWISATLRRQIQTRAYARKYDQAVHRSILEFLTETGQPRLELIYEDVLLQPDATLRRLNDYLGTTLTLDHLKRIYHGQLYRKPRGWMDLAKAYLIYFKNYSERYR